MYIFNLKVNIVLFTKGLLPKKVYLFIIFIEFFICIILSVATCGNNYKLLQNEKKHFISDLGYFGLYKSMIVSH